MDALYTKVSHPFPDKHTVTNLNWQLMTTEWGAGEFECVYLTGCISVWLRCELIPVWITSIFPTRKDKTDNKPYHGIELTEEAECKELVELILLLLLSVTRDRGGAGVDEEVEEGNS